MRRSSPSARTEELLRRAAGAVTEISIAHPRRAVLVGCAVVAAAAFGLPRLELRTDGRALVPPELPAVRFDAEVREHFGLRDPIVVAVETEHPDGIHHLDMARLVVDLTAAIQALEGVEPERVISLATESGTRVYPGTAEPRPFFDPLPETPRDVENLRRNLEGIDVLIGTLIAEDRRGTAILVGVPPSAGGERAVDRGALYRRIVGLTERFAVPGHRIDVVGAPVAEALLGTHILEDLRLLLPLAITAMAGVLWLACRRFWGVALGLGEVAACLIFTFGVMGFLGVPVYLTTAVLPVILVTLGLADEIHIFWHYQQVLGRPEAGADPRQAVRSTLSEMTRPVLLTSLTTSLGFLSFLASPLDAVRVFGLFAPVGILFCLYWSLSVIPASLTLLAPEAFQPPAAGAASWWGTRRLAPLYRRRRATLTVLAILTLVCGSGVSLLVVQDSWIDGFAPRSRFRLATERVNDRYHGTHLLLAHLAVDPPEREPAWLRFGAAGGLVMPKNLRRIGAFEDFLREQPGVGGVLGPHTHLTTVSFLRYGRREEFRRIPEEPHQVDSMLRRFDVTRGELRRREVVDDARQRAIVTIFLKDANYRHTAELMAAVRRWADEHLEPHGIRLAFAGDVAVSQAMIPVIVRSQVLSLGLALVGAWVALTLLRGSARVALSVIAPSALAVLWVFGLMGWLRIPLGVATSMFCAITLGIGVDYAIHFHERFRRARRAAATRPAIAAAREAGPAIVADTAAIALGFGLLVFSQVPANARLGSLVGWALIVSSILTLVGLGAWWSERREVQGLQEPPGA